ncbi:hypothetical protein JXR93_06315, partial [bacterium]|nr:hypothetical protein [bacterium]
MEKLSNSSLIKIIEDSLLMVKNIKTKIDRVSNISTLIKTFNTLLSQLEGDNHSEIEQSVKLLLFMQMEEDPLEVEFLNDIQSGLRKIMDFLIAENTKTSPKSTEKNDKKKRGDVEKNILNEDNNSNSKKIEKNNIVEENTVINKIVSSDKTL